MALDGNQRALTAPVGPPGGGHLPKLWHLKLNRLFHSLSDEDLRRWVDRITVAMDYPRHSLIYLADEPGERVYVLKYGRVRLYRVGEDGREVTLALLDAGDVFGEEVLAGEVRRTCAEALEPAHVCSLRGQDFVELMRQRPEVAIEALRLIAKHSMRAQGQVEQLAGRSVARRIAGLLVELAARQGSGQGSGRAGSVGPVGPVALGQGLTHQVMASMVGTARQTFTTELGRLVELGHVERTGRRLRLPDLDRLRAFAAGEDLTPVPIGQHTDRHRTPAQRH
ncbi:MAG: Crp/Fnr family transcriptional regulator [Chloroflexi bacterium]|nr:Crp/Fnr family transcriptional regulator [Chloroflexota bacterium]